MTLNQLLVELDGFDDREGIVVMCATNFPESLDPALTRPGRLDKQITIPLPDVKGRREILDMYSKKLILSPNVDLDILARRYLVFAVYLALLTFAPRSSGMSGADLFNVLNVAAVRATTLDAKEVDGRHLEEAFDRS